MGESWSIPGLKFDLLSTKLYLLSFIQGILSLVLLISLWWAHPLLFLNPHKLQSCFQAFCFTPLHSSIDPWFFYTPFCRTYHRKRWNTFSRPLRPDWSTIETLFVLLPLNVNLFVEKNIVSVFASSNNCFHQSSKLYLWICNGFIANLDFQEIKLL